MSDVCAKKQKTKGIRWYFHATMPEWDKRYVFRLSAHPSEIPVMHASSGTGGAFVVFDLFIYLFYMGRI